jgi:hypothetical protein
MKTISAAKLHHALFSQEGGALPVKVIKAEQAARLLPGATPGACAAGDQGPRKSSEVRLVGTGPDYCDLEIVCGCGEVTRFRCWNTPSTDANGAK